VLENFRLMPDQIEAVLDFAADSGGAALASGMNVILDENGWPAYSPP
jgi:hypothetical protein